MRVYIRKRMEALADVYGEPLVTVCLAVLAVGADLR